MSIGELFTFVALFAFAVVVLPLLFVVIEDEYQQRKWEKKNGK